MTVKVDYRKVVPLDKIVEMKPETVPVFANRAPWNELVLRGKRQVKTLSFNWKYRGPILLYTSSNRTDEWGLYEYKVRGLRMEDIPTGKIVGYATVVDVVPTFEFEHYDKYQKFYDKDPALVGTLGQSHVVIIKNPKRFKKPFAHTPPQGTVRISRALAHLLDRPTV